MGDWYTGSGTVVLKEIVKYGFGVNPSLSGLNICMPKFMNCENAELQINIKGKKVIILYENKNENERKYFIDSVLQSKTYYDKILDGITIYIPSEELHDGMIIKVTD